jgi:hypothetical protein
MACTGIHVLDPRCQLGSVAGSVADDAFSKMAQSFGSAAAGAVNWLWKQINEATKIDLSSAGITHDLLATGAIALILCTGLFLIQVITSALRREAGGLMRAVRGLGIATIASSFAIAATKIVLAAVDDLSAGVVQFATGTSIDGLGSRFGLAGSLANMSNPAAVLLFSLVILAGVVIVWAAMMMRKMLIIVAAVMTPLAFAGGAADITRGWVRRWIEFTAALIASMLLVIMLVIGLSVFEGAGLAHSPESGSVAVTQSGTQLATGTVLLLLAGLAPWMAIKMFHFAGDSLHAVHSQAQAARAGTQSMVAAPRKVNTAMSQGRSLGGHAGMGSPTVRSTASKSAGVTAPLRGGGGPAGTGAAAAAAVAPVIAGKAIADRAGKVSDTAADNGHASRPTKPTN